METQLIRWHPQETDLQIVLKPIIILEPNNEFWRPSYNFWGPIWKM